MMDDLRLAAVAARVVDWHNRHPLARRISAAHVHAVGYVGLPFVGPAPATTAAVPLPDLATLQADFREGFIHTLSPRAVARFAIRAGQVLARPPGDGPVREVPADGAHPGRHPARVYLLTAVVETGTRKSRVLLGTGLAAPVLGQRILETPRVLALAGLAGLAVGMPAWLLQPADAPPPSAQAVAPAAMPSASAAGGEAAATLALAPAAGASHVEHTVAPIPALAKSTPQSLALPSIRPVISEEDKARARQTREALDARQTTAAPVPPEAPMVTATLPQATQPPAPAPAAATFALSSRPLRTRAEAEQVQVAMRSLLKTIGVVDVKVDVLPQGDDWRVVALPFPHRTAVDKARALLVSRGVRVEVVDF